MRLANKLGKTPAPTTPQEDHIKSQLAQIELHHTQKIGSCRPQAWQITNQSDPKGACATLRVEARRSNDSILWLATQPPTGTTNTFWTILAEGLKAHQPLFTNEQFGTRLAGGG